MRLVALAAGLILAASAAHAAVTEAGHTAPASIDFRTWTGADASYSWSQDGVTARAYNGRYARRLHQDQTDGLGVQRYRWSSDDEIEKREVLAIDFDHAHAVKAILFSDLFDAPDGGKDGEEAFVRIFLKDGGWITAAAYGNFADQANGEATLNLMQHLNGKLVTAMRFYASKDWGDDYSVAGISTVPLPAAAWLLGAGVLGLGAMRRRSKSA